MPGGTSGEGKTPTSQQAAADKQQGGGGGGRRKPATADESALIAQILASASQAAQASSSVTMKDVAETPQFDPSAFLAAKQGLDQAYTDAEGKTQDTIAPGPISAGSKGGAPGMAGAMAARAQTLPANLNEEAGVVAAQKAYDDQLRIRRADALNSTAEAGDVPASNKDLKQDVRKISWDKYNNMTNLQRAAVDYNTMLWQAAKRDNRNRVDLEDMDLSAQGYTNYREAVTGMFPGDTGVAINYAPETVAFLKQIGYEGGAEADLNDFLNGNASLGMKDLKNLDKSADLGLRRAGAGDMFSNPVKEERMDFLGGLVSQTQDAKSEALSQALDSGNKLLMQFSNAAFTNARSDMVSQLGGTPASSSGPGLTGTEADAEFQQVFDYFADKSQDSGSMLYALQSDWTDQKRKQFMSYAQKRLLTAAQEGLDPTTSQLIEPRTAEEIAKLLELNGSSLGGVDNGR